MSASYAIRPAQPSTLHNLSNAQLADEHRGHSFAKRRADEKLKEIEAELDRRGLTSAKGAIALTTKKPGSQTFLDIPRIRADMGDAFCAKYAKPNSFWSSRTLTAEERA